jgi:hypothetical protein
MRIRLSDGREIDTDPESIGFELFKDPSATPLEMNSALFIIKFLHEQIRTLNSELRGAAVLKEKLETEKRELAAYDDIRANAIQALQWQLFAEKRKARKARKALKARKSLPARGSLIFK